MNKLYYSITSFFYNNGKVKIVNIYISTTPITNCGPIDLDTCNIYVDVFTNKKDFNRRLKNLLEEAEATAHIE